jgi:hypothetical protein
MSNTRAKSAIRWGAVARLVCFVLLLVAANLIARHYMEALSFPIRPGNEDAVHHAIMVASTVYTILLALPFVPGAEIGISLMAMLGARIALLVYLCTVTGLSLAFVIGRIVPLSVLANFSHDLGLARTSLLLREIEPLDKQQRLALLVDRAPKRLVPLLIRYRYLALAVALNIPGNYLIGGGGGISLFAGISRLYSVVGFMLTIVFAVAPVPLAVMLLGRDILQQ